MQLLSLLAHYVRSHFAGLFFSFLFCISIPAHAQFWQWAKGVQSLNGPGNSGSSYLSSVVTDATGNVYVAGGFNSDSISFGSFILRNASTRIDSYYNYYDMFVVKYNAAGEVLWAKSFGSKLDDEVASAAIDASGNVYITGSFESDTIIFGSTMLINTAWASSGYANMLMVKIDSLGNVIWAKGQQGDGESWGEDIAVDLHGDLFITGAFYGPLIIGIDTLRNVDYSDMFIAKYDSSGNALWADQAFNELYNENGGISLTTDVSGNVYVTGSFEQEVTFGIPYTTISSPGTVGVFLAKYSATGSFIWAKGAGGSGYDNPFTLKADKLGNIYLAGTYTSPAISFGSTTLTNTDGNDMFLVKYDTAGNALWAKNYSGYVGSDYNYLSMCTDDTGNVYVAGDFSGSHTTFGFSTIYNSGPWATTDVFIAKYGTGGDPLWAVDAGGTGNDNAGAITADHFGNIYLTGSFVSTNINFGDLTLTNSSTPAESELYITKLNTAFNRATSTPIVTVLPNNATIYPNPNNGQMTISFSAPGCTGIQVYDCLGQLVYTSVLTGAEHNTEIDIHTLVPGSYYLHVTGNSGMQNIPFVISR